MKTYIYDHISNQRHTLCSITFFWKTVLFMTQCGKIQLSQTGTDDNIIQRQKDAKTQMYTRNFFILNILCATI